MNDKGVTSVFVHGYNEKYGKEGKIGRSFNTWTILGNGNLIVHFCDLHHQNQNVMISK